MSETPEQATVRVGPSTTVTLPLQPGATPPPAATGDVEQGAGKSPDTLGPRHLVTNDFSLIPTPGLADFLAQQQISLVTSTYGTGRLLLIGRKETGELVYTTRMFEQAMGLCVDRDQVHLSTLNTIWHFYNSLPAGGRAGDYDAVYVPRTCHVTGLLDIHDMTKEASGRLVFVNTLFSCVATTEDGFSFKPIWTPPWVSALVPEDRSHLNGLCTRDGVIRYITAVNRSDQKEGWRVNRATSGVLWDIVEKRPVLEGLCMPHSPRWDGQNLYFLNAGSGYLCQADIASGTFREIAFCAGFVRGLSIHNGYAYVGISDKRASRTFSDLPLDANLEKHGASPRCAILIVNLTTCVIEHEVRFEGQIRELYDVAVLPGVRRPYAIGFQRDEINFLVQIAKP